MEATIHVTRTTGFEAIGEAISVRWQQEVRLAQSCELRQIFEPYPPLWINGNERSWKEYVGEQKHGWSVL